MEERLATKLLNAALALDNALGEMDAVVSCISDQSEKKQYAKNLGDILGAVNEKFIRPIIRQHPHLRNDRTE